MATTEEPPAENPYAAPLASDEHYQRARQSVEQTLQHLKNCTAEERLRLAQDFSGLVAMAEKLERGRVDIVIFGEISTGKSALINALLGAEVAAVDVRGGWTKEVWHLPWDGCGYCVPGLAQSQVVLVDTPGLNEVGGGARTEMAREAAQRAELILFVTDSDLNETEFAALEAISSLHKPIILVLNKLDIYSPAQRQRLLEVLRGERVAHLLRPSDVVTAAADPREVEYVIEDASGQSRHEWRKPPPDIADVKAKILEVLDREGLALIALNASLYAGDKEARLAALRVELRRKSALQTVWSFAALKAISVALNPIPMADMLGGAAVDVSMVVVLSRIYGLQMSWQHAQGLVASILKAAGWMFVGEATTSILSSLAKGATFGWSTAFSAIPQGTAAGFGSYIVGQAARYYFEHNAGWGGKAPKAVVRDILRETDKQSVLTHLKQGILSKLLVNPHSEKKT